MGAVTPTLQNYEFLPVPAIVKLGGRLVLTMAGCVDPAPAAATCPAPTLLADSVTAAAGSLRQTSPTEFEYIAPAVMPSNPMVAISASYQRPFQHQVLGMVMLIAPKALTSPPPKPGRPPGDMKWVTYNGFISVLVAPPNGTGSWTRNHFWLRGDNQTSKTIDGGDDNVLLVKFKRLDADMSELDIDSERKHVHFSEGHEDFEGEDEVFSHLVINLTRQLYGWQAHGQRLGDRPATSTTYHDSGYNSSCGNPSYVAVRSATLPYTDLGVLAGTLNCGIPTQYYGREDYGEGVILNWTFVLSFE